MLQFKKMHGLGNDFVVLDGRNGAPSLNHGQIIKMADRRHGIGCDQVIVIEPSDDPGVTAGMRIFNPDGSEAGMCGNAARCVADILMKESAGNVCCIKTISRVMTCWRVGMDQVRGGQIRVDMGVPHFEWTEVPLAGPCDTLHLPISGDPVAVSMGNPHCVFFVEDVEKISVETVGPEIEKNSLFPNRTNVEFIQILAPDRIRMRVWERGTGQTLACGSGACAALVAAVRRGLSDHRVEVILDGGSLTLEWGGDGTSVLMTGPVDSVFEGVFYGNLSAHSQDDKVTRI